MDDMNSPPPSPSAKHEHTQPPAQFPVVHLPPKDLQADHPSEPSGSSSVLPEEPTMDSPGIFNDRTIECPGIYLDWPTGEFWSQYPFQRHEFSLHNLGYKFCAVDGNGTQFRVRSDRCNRIPMPDGTACPECLGISKTVERLASMAQCAEPRTNHKYLSHQQLCGLLDDRDETVKGWKLKVRAV